MSFLGKYLMAACTATALIVGSAVAQMPVARVVVDQAKLMDAPKVTTLVGTVYASRISQVASEMEGIVAAMPVRQGDRVEAGGLLCKLNDETLSFRLVEEQSLLESRRAQYDELVAGTRVEELTRLKALLDEATSNYDRWKFEMDRVGKLYETHDANEKEFKDTRAEFLSTQRRKIAAEALYHKAESGPRKESIAKARYDVAAQQAVVHRLKSNLEKTSILAPYTGYITKRLTEQGEWVTTGGPVVELADLSRVLVRVDAPEDTLPYLTVGAAAHVWIDALGRRFNGSIKHIIRSADLSARTFPIEIEVENPDGVLASGQFARVTLPAGENEPTVAVPKDAIVERDGVTYVGVVMPAHGGGTAAVLQPVTIGADVGDWVAVTSDNLQPGAGVVTRGTERILPFPRDIVIVDPSGTPVEPPATPPDAHQKANPHGHQNADASQSH